MRLPRRQFLRTGLTSIVSAGISLTVARTVFGQKRTRGQVGTTVEPDVQLPWEVLTDPVYSFKPETFRPYVGGIFTAPNALGRSIELELLSVRVFRPVNAQQSPRRAITTESFSLTFKSAAELPPFTSIHRINHPSLGEFGLFLTKRMSDNGDLLYEAVINHIK
jgi:hypothetical protein